MASKILKVYNPELPFILEGFTGNVYIDGQFSNGNTKDNMSFKDVLRWKFSKNPQKEEKKKDPFKIQVLRNEKFLMDTRDMLVWLGHASFFIRAGGKAILTDPVFFNLPFIKRKADLPCDPEAFKNIDYLLLSHVHRDHFDKKTLKLLFDNNPGVKVFGPLGIAKLVKSIYKRVQVQEAGWYQKFDLETDDLELDFLPALHWNRRGLLDFNNILWGSMMLTSKGKKIYFCGDSAYAPHFRTLGNLYKSVDIALMPIGAYKPHYLMNKYHVNPKQSLKAFRHLNGKAFIPMHYGTFDLSDEPLGEPIKKISRLFEREERKDDLKILKIGEEFVF